MCEFAHGGLCAARALPKCARGAAGSPELPS